jgi:UrcA family protein
VEAGDLDLGSDQGQRILALRIQRAARALCKPQAVASLPRSIRSERSCIRAARASAAAAVKAMTAAGDPPSDMGG